jgi:hypothetical protein
VLLKVIDPYTVSHQRIICIIDSPIGGHILADLLSTLLQDTIRMFFFIIIDTEVFLQYQRFDG